MKWHKNLAAKLAVLAASVGAVLAGWLVIRQDLPPTDTAVAGTTTAAASPTLRTTRTTNQQRTQTQTTLRTHTRTRVS